MSNPAGNIFDMAVLIDVVLTSSFSEVNFVFILFPKCLQYLDVSVLGELVPRLCELIRSGVGLGTKVSKCIFSQEEFSSSLVWATEM